MDILSKKTHELFLPKIIANIVDNYINNRFPYESDIQPFDTYINQSPQPAFSTILLQNYHNQCTYRFFEHMNIQIGLIVPDRSKQRILSELRISNFLTEMQSLYAAQLADEQAKITAIITELNASDNPTHIAQIAKILGIRENKK